VCKTAFLRFLEFLYCDKFIRPMTFSELKKVGDIFLVFKLNKSFLIVKKYLEFAETKIH